MHVVFLAGGIASGKSTAAKTLAGLGATVIDLDELSREALRPGSPILPRVQEAFGEDVVDPATGAVRRRLLAERAFLSAERTVTLEEIELPYIEELLRDRLARIEAADAEAGRTGAGTVVVVEVPLLDRMRGAFDLADETVCVVSAPVLRRRFAILRGMDAEDYSRRAAQQPSDAYLKAHSSRVFENFNEVSDLVRDVRAWWEERSRADWAPVRGRGTR